MTIDIKPLPTMNISIVSFFEPTCSRFVDKEKDLSNKGSVLSN